MPSREFGEIQIALIQGLLKLRVEQKMITPIMAMANSEEKADRMLDWIVENQEATDKEILHKAAELSPELVQHY